jgi:hypothetical protein
MQLSIDVVPVVMLAIGIGLLLVSFVILFPDLRKEEAQDTALNLAVRSKPPVSTQETIAPPGHDHPR